MEAEVRQRQAPEEGRRDAHGMDGGANIVAKAGNREFPRTGAAADLVGRFVYINVMSFTSEGHGRRQAVRTRTDNHHSTASHSVSPLRSVPIEQGSS